MSRGSDARPRHEITEQIDHTRDDLQEGAEETGKVVADMETVGETYDSLDRGGTLEGADEVEEAIRSAEDVTVEVFEHKDQEVEQLQEQGQEHGDDLQERSDRVESDIDKILDASGRIETQETRSELGRAEEVDQRDLEFLKAEGQRNQETLAESKQIQETHRAQMDSHRRS